MANKKDLKQNLKAAAKRRSRRPPGDPEVIAALEMGSMSSNQIDVAGLVIEQIMLCDRERTLKDADVIAALRAILEPASYNPEASPTLHAKLREIDSRDDVSTHRFRKAVQSVLNSATSHRRAEDDLAFMRYLLLLAN